LTSIRLNVSSPSIGEEYHATWERKNRDKLASRSWRTEIPLFLGNLNVGRLVVSGAVSDDSAFGHMADFLDALKPFEEQFLEMLRQESADGCAPTSAPVVVPAQAHAVIPAPTQI
jgi:hypothetical protein